MQIISAGDLVSWTKEDIRNSETEINMPRAPKI
jgi:hypothetical protein